MENIIHSPSGWSYHKDQENGDLVDCQWCGYPLDDNHPIVNDKYGYAYHQFCFKPDATTVWINITTNDGELIERVEVFNSKEWGIPFDEIKQGIDRAARIQEVRQNDIDK